MYDRNKLIVAATLGDLEDLLVNVLARTSQQSTESTRDNKDTVLRGIEGICQALGVGKTKAQEIKNSGKLDEAIDQVSARIFYVHTEKAKELYRKIV